MKALAIKGAIGAVGVTGLTAGGYYGYQALNKETKIEKVTIAKKLEKEKYKLLNSNSNSEHFVAILGSYKTSNLKFADFNGNPANNETANTILLRHCEATLKDENSESEDYSKAKKWCVEPISVEELLKKRNINALSTEDTPTTNNKKWENKIKAYRNRADYRIDGVQITTSGTITPSAEEIRNFKEKCGIIKVKKNHEDKFDEMLKAFELWCSDN